MDKFECEKAIAVLERVRRNPAAVRTEILPDWPEVPESFLAAVDSEISSLKSRLKRLNQEQQDEQELLQEK